MEGILSQKEIDALLGLGGDDEVTTNEAPRETKIEKSLKLTKEEIDAIGEMGNISLGSSSTALSTLLMKEVSITTPRVLTYTFDELKSRFDNEDKALIQIEYKKGFEGLNILLINKSDAVVIGDLMMGNDGSAPPKEIDDLYLSAVGEAMNQMMGSAATSLAGMFKKEIDIMPPIVKIRNMDELKIENDFFIKNQEFVAVEFDMKIEGLVDTSIFQIMDMAFVKEITKEMYSLDGMGTQEVKKEKSNNQEAGKTANVQNNNMGGQNIPPGYQQNPWGQMPPMGYGPWGGQMPIPPQGWGAMPPQQPGIYGAGMNYNDVNVQPVQFASFGNETAQNMPSNIDLIMDVPLEVTVELGRTKMQIKEILDLGAGSIVELDKLAGEPVDVLVNGKLIAKGEVVVIDESFGIRITNIVSQMERLGKIQ